MLHSNRTSYKPNELHQSFEPASLSLERDGFAIVRNVLTIEEISKLSQELTDLFETG